jgi:hypothetical protein
MIAANFYLGYNFDKFTQHSIELVYLAFKNSNPLQFLSTRDRDRLRQQNQ